MSADLDTELRALFDSDPRALADPYPLYRELRERSPVRELGSTVVLSRFDDVKAAARDSARLSSRVFSSDRAEEAMAGMSEEAGAPTPRWPRTTRTSSPTPTGSSTRGCGAPPTGRSRRGGSRRCGSAWRPTPTGCSTSWRRTT